MLILLCNSYQIAKKAAEDIFQDTKLKVCAIETEYGDNVLNERNKAIGISFNHHSNSNENHFQPSLAFNHPLLKNKKYDVFILSHIDTDSVFGIGWATGLFPKITKFIEVARIISEIDVKGFHNVNIPKKYTKLINCIFSIVRSYKNLSKYSIKNDCTKLIKKAILKIRDLFYNHELVDTRYKYIQQNISNSRKIKDKLSTENISVYTSRYNNFKETNNDFLINYTGTISLFCRDEQTVLKYFKDGLVPIIQEFFGIQAGGSLTAVGSGRNYKVSNSEFKEFIKWFNEKLQDHFILN